MTRATGQILVHPAEQIKKYAVQTSRISFIATSIRPIWSGMTLQWRISAWMPFRWNGMYINGFRLHVHIHQISIETTATIKNNNSTTQWAKKQRISSKTFKLPSKSAKIHPHLECATSFPWSLPERRQGRCCTSREPDDPPVAPSLSTAVKKAKWNDDVHSE